VCLGCWFCLPAAAEPKLGEVLSGIERHYNSLGTMRVEFAQTREYAGRPRLHERGTLSLRRPKKMRWDYREPKGKLLVGDGEILHMYNPLTNQVRPIPLDDTGDLRAPLSFLLGRLNFRRQFRDVRFESIDGVKTIVGDGRRDKDPYDRVEFTYDTEALSLKRLRVIGRDGTYTTTFAFADEERNVRLDESLFVFEPPPGAEMFDPPSAGADQ
jgi:outer membrane lipoprotein carrier protein